MLHIVWCLSARIDNDREPCKIAEQNKMPLGDDPRIHVFDRVAGVHTGAIWQIRLNDQKTVAMRAVATVTVSLSSVVSHTRTNVR